MGEPNAPADPGGSRTGQNEPEAFVDPLTRDNLADADAEEPVDLDPEPDPDPAYDDEPDELDEFDDEFDEDPDDFEEAFDPEDGHGPQLAPGPKHGPGHHRGPDEHGPKKHAGKKAPGKKAPGKKVPGKKAPAKKVPGPKKHAPGPKKHPGHPPPPHHGPRAADHEPGAQPDFELGPETNFGFGSGPGLFGPRGRTRGRRSRPGDVRAAILLLLSEQPMHGYEMIQQIAERSRGMWRPSPGSVYPTLQLLDDEGLVSASEPDGSRKLFALTDSGRAAADKVKTPPWEEFGNSADADHVDLRQALSQLFGAAAQAAQVASIKQQQLIVDIVHKARRKIYGILADSD